MASKISERLCVGCGDDINVKSNDRRSLTSTVSGKSVLKTWKSFVEKKIESSQCFLVNIPLDNLLEQFYGGLMCRSCFSSFERIAKLQNNIDKNLNSFLEVLISMEPQISGRKVSRRQDADEDIRGGNRLVIMPPMPNISQSQTSSLPISPMASTVIGTSDQHRWYNLTPHRRKLGKAVGRKSYKSIAAQSWSNKDVQPYLKKLVCLDLKREFRSTCSNSSVLFYSDSESLKSFTWNKLDKEIKRKAPFLYQIMLSITQTDCAKTLYETWDQTRQRLQYHELLKCVTVSVLCIDNVYIS